MAGLFAGSLGSALVAAILSAGSANASTIDTTGSLGRLQAEFGSPNTATFGQTFVAPDPVLTSFSMFLEGRASFGKPFGDGPLDLRDYIGA